MNLAFSVLANFPFFVRGWPPCFFIVFPAVFINFPLFSLVFQHFSSIFPFLARSISFSLVLLDFSRLFIGFSILVIAFLALFIDFSAVLVDFHCSAWFWTWCRCCCLWSCSHSCCTYTPVLFSRLHDFGIGVARVCDCFARVLKVLFVTAVLLVVVVDFPARGRAG